AIEREALDDNVACALRCQQRETRRAGRLAREPEILAKARVELEPISRTAHQRSLDDEGSAIVNVRRTEDDTIANLEPPRIAECDLSVIPVGVVAEVDRSRRDLRDDGFSAATNEADP